MSYDLVLGASIKPHRYSNKAISRLRSHGKDVLAISNKPGTVSGVDFSTAPIYDKDICTITIYLNPQIQKEYYDYILKVKPKRLIFNPGAENLELEKLALENGIITVRACTLVMLSIGNYDL